MAAELIFIHLIFYFIALIFFAFLILSVASFIFSISKIGKDKDLNFPERYRASIFSKKWWLYVLLLAMFLMIEFSVRGMPDQQMRKFLGDGLFFLAAGYFFRFEVEKIVGDNTTERRREKIVAKWGGNIFLVLGFSYLLITGLIYFLNFDIGWYMDLEIWFFITLILALTLSKRSIGMKRGDSKVIH